MTPSARIQAVIELLDLVMYEQRPADGITSSFFRSRRYIGSKDRAFINQTLYTLMRRYHRLNWWLERVGNRELSARNQLIADYALAGQGVAEFFGVEGTYGPTSLTRDEIDLIRAVRGNKLEDPEMPMEIRNEVPEWAAEKLQNDLKDNFETEMQAMMQPAFLDLRINLLKSDRQTVFKRLLDDGIECELGVLSPWCIRVHGRPPLSRHPLFINGTIEVQDQGSQLVALAASPKPGDRVVDFCAGAGGKTLAMAAMMENKGLIIASDVLERRLLRAKKRFRRAGAFNIETRPLDTEHDKWVKRHKGKYDIVLVDAPCSGTGTWRRDPDKRFKMLGPNLLNLVDLQGSILQSAARLVKPEGRLVYATCSLLNVENEDCIETFLKNNDDFTVVPISDVWADSPTTPYLNITPAQHNTDGFFTAVLKRKAKQS